jgi:hypothetical protein
MAILGMILLALGFFLNIYLLVVLGAILLIVGLVLMFVPIGGTRHRWY